MTSVHDSPAYLAGYEAARRDIDAALALHQFPTPEAAARYHADRVTKWEEPGMWRAGYLSCCTEVAEA